MRSGYAGPVLRRADRRRDADLWFSEEDQPGLRQSDRCHQRVLCVSTVEQDWSIAGRTAWRSRDGAPMTLGNTVVLIDNESDAGGTGHALRQPRCRSCGKTAASLSHVGPVEFDAGLMLQQEAPSSCLPRRWGRIVTCRCCRAGKVCGVSKISRAVEQEPTRTTSPRERVDNHPAIRTNAGRTVTIERGTDSRNVVANSDPAVSTTRVSSGQARRPASTSARSTTPRRTSARAPSPGGAPASAGCSRKALVRSTACQGWRSAGSTPRPARGTRRSTHRCGSVGR